MATCKRCGSDKLTEHPCPNCGTRSNISSIDLTWAKPGWDKPRGRPYDGAIVDDKDCLIIPDKAS